MKIIDCHVHVDLYDEKNMNGINKNYDIDDILISMKKSKIDYSCLLTIAQKNNLEITKNANNRISQFSQNNNKLIGFGSIHPSDKESALKEMERCKHDLGLRGFKLHPNTQNFDCSDPDFIKILQKAAELELPIILDSYSPFDIEQPSKILKAVLASPETKLCLAHVGMYHFTQFGIYGFLKNYTAFDLNVFFDLSASLCMFINSPYQEQFLWITEQIGYDKLIFGSDFPLFTQDEDVSALKGFGYKENLIPKILSENFMKILGLKYD